MKYNVIIETKDKIEEVKKHLDNSEYSIISLSEYKTKFYTMIQNNSGGYLIRNEEVTDVVIVEAKNHRQAYKIAEQIVDDYSEYCTCCGERWDYDFYEEDGQNEPMIYNVSVYEEKKGHFRKEAFIYFLDGRKEKVVFKDGDKKCIQD
jgi:hypothetical protein